MCIFQQLDPALRHEPVSGCLTTTHTTLVTARAITQGSTGKRYQCCGEMVKHLHTGQSHHQVLSVSAQRHVNAGQLVPWRQPRRTPSVRVSQEPLRQGQVAEWNLLWRAHYPRRTRWPPSRLLCQHYWSGRPPAGLTGTCHHHLRESCTTRRRGAVRTGASVAAPSH